MNLVSAFKRNASAADAATTWHTSVMSPIASGLAVYACAATLLAAIPGTALAQSDGFAAANALGAAPSPSNRIMHRGATPESPAETLYNRLKVGTLVEFDKATGSVNEAMTSLLAPVGYRVTDRTVDASLSKSVLNRPVPPAARDAGVMSIESAMLLLIGEENRLVVDHTNRLVAVESLSVAAATAPTPAPVAAPVAAPTAMPLAAPQSPKASSMPANKPDAYAGCS